MEDVGRQRMDRRTRFEDGDRRGSEAEGERLQSAFAQRIPFLHPPLASADRLL